jgi:hypothetical protein
LWLAFIQVELNELQYFADKCFTRTVYYIVHFDWFTGILDDNAGDVATVSSDEGKFDNQVLHNSGYDNSSCQC